jgi:hypothetical protein
MKPIKSGRWRVVLIGLLALGAGLAPAAEKLRPDVQKALASIRPAEAYEINKTLASPKFAGRLTGSEGYTAAAKWAAGRFKEWGLQPISRENGYLQPYPSPYVLVDKAELAFLIPEKQEGAAEPSIKEIKLQPEKEFLPLLFSDSGSRTAEMVFAGWGISAPDLGYDDYAGLDVKGKFVLCFRGTPDGSDRRFESYAHHRFRMKTAKDKGALGILYIYDEIGSNPNGDWIEGFTPAEISYPAADLVLRERDTTAADLRKTLVNFKRPLSFPLRAKASLTVASRHFPDGVGYNVAGWVAGSDPKLKTECLVVGGHFDHNGLHMGLLFPGADDNASGSAAVMEAAQAFTKLAAHPKRSVMFVLFGGEEKGLQGSEYFAGHLPSGFEKVDTMFNFDMVGEGDRSGIGYSAGSPELKSLVEEADGFVHTLATSSPIRGVGVRGSDHAPFFQRGIPCISFHSNGPHLFYHQTGDTIYRINPDMLADVARLAFLAAWRRADR